MRVIQVLYSGLGGHGSVVSSLVQADRAGTWSHRLIFYGVEDLLPAYQAFSRDYRIPYIYVKKRRGVFRLPGKEVYNGFASLQPDAIILHSPTLILPAWLYCLRHRKKLFVVEHTPHASKGRAERIATLLSLLLARKVVCLSETYRKELQKRVPFLDLSKRTVVIRNGIDLSRFSPLPVKERQEFHIGMAGRFSSQKYQELVLQTAIAGFANGQLDKQVHFHFAGEGETLNRLKKLAAEKGLESQVHFHGLLGETEMLAFFRQLDLYVHASFAETMCTSVMQAMACGLPVVGSDIPGINDLLPAGDNTIVLLPNNEPETWLKQMLSYRDRILRDSKAVQARQAAEKHFSATVTFDRYSQLIAN